MASDGDENPVRAEIDRLRSAVIAGEDVHISDHLDVNAKSSRGTTLLVVAAQHGKQGVVHQLLVREDTDVNPVSPSGHAPPLIGAACYGHLEVVRALLAHKDIKVNLKFRRRETALYAAAARGHYEVVRALLAHEDIDINMTDGYARTALYVAIYQGNPAIAKLLREDTRLEPEVRSIMSIGMWNTLKELRKSKCSSGGDHGAVTGTFQCMACTGTELICPLRPSEVAYSHPIASAGEYRPIEPRHVPVAVGGGHLHTRSKHT